MITGGNFHDILDSTEVLDIDDGSVTMASPMNSERAWHGTGIITVNGEDRVAVFGGRQSLERGDKLDSVELYNTKTEKWEMADFKLSEVKSAFGFLTVKVGDILSKLPGAARAPKVREVRMPNLPPIF